MAEERGILGSFCLLDDVPALCGGSFSQKNVIGWESWHRDGRELSRDRQGAVDSAGSGSAGQVMCEWLCFTRQALWAQEIKDDLG